MKVSIITVCYNSEATIERTVRSVVNQTHRDIEYLVIDGGSEDMTLELLEPYRSRINCIVSEKDRGLYDAVNKGISLATGDLIGLLHADDWLADSEVVGDLVKKIENEGTDSVYADLQYVQGDKVVRNWMSGDFSIEKFRRGWMPPHPTFYIKRSVLKEESSLYRTDFGTAADYEFMLRMLVKRKVSVCYLPRVLVKMQMGGLSNESLLVRLRANAMDARAWKVNGLKPFLFFRLFKPMRKLLQWA